METLTYYLIHRRVIYYFGNKEVEKRHPSDSLLNHANGYLPPPTCVLYVGRNCATDMNGRLDALLDDINHTNISNGNIGNAYLMDIHNHYIRLLSNITI